MVITSSKEIPKEAGVCRENFKVALHPNFSNQEVAIEGTLSTKRRTELCSLLKENLDIFEWHPSDMKGVPRSVVEHRLNIREGYSPVGHKKRGQALERAKAIQAELANMCRFHGFKQGLSAGLLPLPKIDWKVESLCGYPFKCFLDAYKGYHQIQLAKSDEEKMAFHTGQGVYCYTKMPFGLKNADATYQRLVDNAFDSQIGQNIEVYIDDLVIKSHTEAEMLKDIGETFRTLRKINMKLNPKNVLADFLVEIPNESPPDASVVETQQEPWTLFTDGSSCVDGSGVGLILTSPEGTQFTYALRFQFAAFNNEVEYEALTAGLRIAAQIGFTKFSINQVPRSKNKKADALSKIASTSFTHLSKQVLVKILKEKSIQEKEVTIVVEEDGPTWITPIMEYLKEGTIPSDRNEARKLRIKARQYELLEGLLYMRSFLTPWLRYVRPLQADYVIREIHKGSCRMHAGPCPHQPLTLIMAPWPFYKWGIDIACPFPEAPGIKARLGEGNKNWVEELPHVLYAHCTMIKSSHGDTPFSLTCGTEAVIPAEIGMPTYCTTIVDIIHNDEELRLNLDLLEERRERAAIREAKAKLKMTKYYNARVRGVTFRPGDFVYRSNDASHAVN
nr:reverse transcriptase domain-containing protein [Tanacetum cinerariifolium]